MSAGEDSRLARWSRRKLAARSSEGDRQEETPPPAQAETEPDAPAPTPAPTPEPVAEEDSESLEPLPRIEDLTAESDLSAFLRKGVPEELRSAAIRRMWSLDPRIRDYVGPAEYAWDFNQPGSMKGFGPLEAGKAVVGFLSKAVEAAESEGTLSDQAALEPSVDESTEREASAHHDDKADGGDAPAPAGERQQPATPQRTEAIQARSDAAEPAPKPPTRRHGGALPG